MLWKCAAKYAGSFTIRVELSVVSHSFLTAATGAVLSGMLVWHEPESTAHLNATPYSRLNITSKCNIGHHMMMHILTEKIQIMT